MAISTQTQNLNLIPGKSAPVVVHLSQGNVGDTVQFYLYNGTDPYIPSGVSIAVHGVRADGTAFGPYAVSITSGSNLVSFPVETAMTSVSGEAVGELVITDARRKQIGTANFGMIVESAPYSSSVTYEYDLSIYQRILAHVQSSTAAWNNQIATMNSRIDNIIAPAGGAPSAEEVVDARLGADGTTYGTLGTSIRTQVNELSNDIDYNKDKIRSAIVSTNLAYNYDFVDGYLQGDGSIGKDSDHVTSDYIFVHGASSICINSAVRYALYSENKSLLQVISPTSTSNVIIPVGSNVFHIRYTTEKANRNGSILMETSDPNDLDDIAWKFRNSWPSDMVSEVFVLNNEIYNQTFVEGYLSGNGSGINSTPYYFTSDYISTRGAKSIVINKALRYALYDSDKNVVLTGSNPGTNILLPLGNNVSYMRFTIDKHDRDSSAVLLSNNVNDLNKTFTVYDAVNEIKSTMAASLVSSNLLKYVPVEKGYLSSDGKSVNATDEYYTSDYISAHKGTLSMINIVRFAMYDKDKLAIGVRNPSPTYNSFSIELGRNVAYVRVTFDVNEKEAALNFGNAVVSKWKPKTEIHNIYVGASDRCDFADIQSAIDSIVDDSITNRYIIYIEPGTYGRIYTRTGKSASDERVRYISFIGLSSCEDTIIYDDKGNYDYSPGEIFITGIIKNLSFINYTTSQTKEPSSLHDYAFAMHVGAFSEGTGAVYLTIENCYFFSNAGAAFGCGTMQDNTIVIRNSKFVSDNETGCNSAVEQGAFYLHTNPFSDTTNQNLKIYNCWIQSKSHTNGASIQERTGHISKLDFEICNTAIIGTNGPDLDLQSSITPTFGSFNNLPEKLNNLTP